MTQSARETIQRYFDAFNAGDTDAMLAIRANLLRRD